eukprot:jgi/Botrbrau1/13354/Bobra.0158s0008.1
MFLISHLSFHRNPGDSKAVRLEFKVYCLVLTCQQEPLGVCCQAHATRNSCLLS